MLLIIFATTAATLVFGLSGAFCHNASQFSSEATSGYLEAAGWLLFIIAAVSDLILLVNNPGGTAIGLAVAAAVCFFFFIAMGDEG